MTTEEDRRNFNFKQWTTEDLIDFVAHKSPESDALAEVLRRFERQSSGREFEERVLRAVTRLFQRGQFPGLAQFPEQENTGKQEP